MALKPLTRQQIKQAGCPTCGERNGAPCKTSKGKVTSYIHACRVYKAWRIDADLKRRAERN